jgi:hypothetical protein
MSNHEEEFVLNIMDRAHESERGGALHPLLRTNWTNLDTELDVYFSTDDGIDSIFINLMIDSQYKKQVGELELSKETGRLSLTGNEGESNFLLIKYPSYSRSYYLSFVLECCSTLTPNNSIEDMEEILFKWIQRWKLKGSSSREKRIGLFGELLILEYLITHHQTVDWKCWQERISDSGLHDFILHDSILEIKTSTSPDALIHVFDSEQFEHNDRLVLILVRLLNDKLNGRSLNSLIENLLELIPQEERKEFKDIMKSLGSRFPEFDNEKFIFSELKWYNSNAGGPFLQRLDLNEKNRVGQNISYSILESQVPFEGQGDLASLSNLLH